MRNLSISMFLSPVIALILVIAFYFLVLHKTSKKREFRQITFLILAFSILLNFVWEMAQMPLYKGMSLNLQDALFCFLASIADAVMVLLLYFGFALIFKNPFWMQKRNTQNIILLILVGGIGAVLAEIRQVSAGSWAYSDAMPIIPVVGVGLSPVVQFMILPVVIYYISFRQAKN